MEKFVENLVEAEKHVSFAGHLIYVTLPVVNENKIILKALSELKQGILKAINSLLQYEYVFKRINLSKDPRINFDIFRNKCAPRYQITPEEVNQIKDLLSLARSHEKSAIEFKRGGKIIILSDDMRPTEINVEMIKKFIEISNSLLLKIKQNMKGD
ncbi:MAG: hypothetical protein ACOCUU_02745 [Nanoarchaeota archaeon]